MKKLKIITGVLLVMLFINSCSKDQKAVKKLCEGGWYIVEVKTNDSIVKLTDYFAERYDFENRFELSKESITEMTDVPYAQFDECKVKNGGFCTGEYNVYFTYTSYNGYTNYTSINETVEYSISDDGKTYTEESLGYLFGEGGGNVCTVNCQKIYDIIELTDDVFVIKDKTENGFEIKMEHN